MSLSKKLKKLQKLSKFLVILALGFLGFVPVYGQSSMGPRPKHSPPPRPDQLEMMKKMLSLSDDQTSKLKALFEDENAQMKYLHSKVMDEIAVLQKKVDSKAPDKELLDSIGILMADQEKIEESQREVRTKMAAILTPLQQARLMLRGNRKPVKISPFGRGQRPPARNPHRHLPRPTPSQPVSTE